MTDTTRLTAQELKQELNGFWGGSDQLYKAQFGAMKYTSGVRYFFQKAGMNGAYWLRDAISTAPGVANLCRTLDFAVVLFTVGDDDKWTLSVSYDCKSIDDSGFRTPEGPICLNMSGEYTDAQHGQWVFYLEGGVLMLPNER